MSTVESSLRWLEKAGDRLNAILVKETRQSLKSRQFVATFLLLVFSSWVISVFGVAMMGDAINYGASGQRLFVFYFVVLMIAVTVIVPYGAFRSMLGEKDQNTFDSLRITSLSPWQIVWGKLMSAVVQDFIYYSAIAPFIAFTSLLEGFELPSVAFLLLCGLLLSVAFSIMALMVSTFAHQRHWQGILSIMLLIGLLSMLGTTTSSLLALFSDSSMLQDWRFWLGFGIVVFLGILYCWLFLQITSAQLTFESGNRSSGIRLISTLQFLIMNALILGLAFWYSGFDDEIFFIICSLTYIQLIAVGLVSVTEENFLSRRIRKSLPSRRISRFLLAPFLPGGSRGMAYLMLNLGICYGLQIVTILVMMNTSTRSYGSIDEVIPFLTGLVFYIIIYLGFASAFGRIGNGMIENLKPNHVRVITLLVFAIGCIIPMMAKALEFLSWRRYSLFEIINPFATLYEISDRNQWSDPVLVILGIAASVALLFNLKAMVLSLYEIRGFQTQQQTETVEVEPFQIPEAPPASSLEEG
ncbi:MAG: hypothetical protein HUJ26_11130 [Planctomycetaceae bacterium]|nr:hypothetical protein [Planctomycetaceae bacterium]